MSTRGISRPAHLVIAVLAATQLAWLDPHHKAREGNRQYEAGKYDEAAARYNEALVDEPDSALLHFNLGDAAYRQQKYADALAAFEKVPSGDADPARTARVAYNIGNAKYRLGEAAAASDPKAALGLWAESLAAYRRAMGAAPDDVDAKFNHELVERKIAELKKKLEEQEKKKQEQEQQSPQDKQQDKQQQPESPESAEQKQEEQKQEEQEQEEQEQKAPEEKQTDEQGQASEDAPAPEQAERKEGEMTQQEAAALLDSQRGEEIEPAEAAKRLQGGVVGEPAEDW